MAPTFIQRKVMRSLARFPRPKPALTIPVHAGCGESILRYVTPITKDTAHCMDCGIVNFNCGSNECKQESCSLHERFRRV